MNGDDLIQARRDEIAKAEKDLEVARSVYRAAVGAPHIPGNLWHELNEIRDANERILYAKHRLELLEWCNESDEQRMRYESDVQR